MLNMGVGIKTSQGRDLKSELFLDQDFVLSSAVQREICRVFRFLKHNAALFLCSTCILDLQHNTEWFVKARKKENNSEEQSKSVCDQRLWRPGLHEQITTSAR